MPPDIVDHALKYENNKYKFHKKNIDIFLTIKYNIVK